MLFPSGIPEAGIAFILDRFKERGGQAFQASQLGVGRDRGPGQCDALDVGGGAQPALAGEGGDPALFCWTEADGGGNRRGGHALQV